MPWSSEPEVDGEMLVLSKDTRFAPSDLPVVDAASREIRVLDVAIVSLFFSFGREGNRLGELRARAVPPTVRSSRAIRCECEGDDAAESGSGEARGTSDER